MRLLRGLRWGVWAGSPHPRDVCQDLWRAEADEQGRGREEDLLEVGVRGRGAVAAGAAAVRM